MTSNGIEQLLEVIQQLSAARDLASVQAIVRCAARSLTGADGATFVLRDGDQCFYADEDAIAPLWKGQRFPMSACISGWTMIHRRAAVIEDIYADPRIPTNAYRPTFVKSLAMVPIRTADPIGAIGNYWATQRTPTPDEVRLLQALADSTSVALANVGLYQQLEGRLSDLSAALRRAEHELSERKRAEEQLRKTEGQLRQAQKMDAIGQLAGGIAHDFNNMLTVILGQSSLILDDLQAADPLRLEIEEVRRAGERAAGLTRQLLAFSRQQVLQLRMLDLNEVVRGMERMLARLLGAQVRLETRLAAGLDAVLADAGQMEQVVMNLAINARDAMPGGGQLTIETKNVSLTQEYVAHHVTVAPGEYVMLAVSDTGIGMDKETQARIFEPFFTTKEKGRGTGLGLSTVYGIVKQSHGHVWPYSEVGVGTTFKVYLPRQAATARREPSQPVEVTSLVGHETVLLVEDDDAVRAVTRGILRRAGYNVLEARNAGEAMLTSEQYAQPIHLLLTDVVMPQLSGVQLARRLGPTRPAMRVLCMSGYTDDAALRHGIIDSALAFVQKPLVPDTLLTKVRQVLDAPPR